MTTENENENNVVNNEENDSVERAEVSLPLFTAAAGKVNKHTAVRGLTDNNDGLDLHTATDSLLLEGDDFISFHKPTEIVVSRNYPGYRVFDISGVGSDEALGLLLSTALDSDSALEEFRLILSSPNYSHAVTNALLPRPGVPVRRGRYVMSEEQINLETEKVLSAASTTIDPNVITAIAAVHTKMFNAMDLVLMGAERKHAHVTDHLALNMASIKSVILRESLRDVFSDARIAEATRQLDSDATPTIIATVIAQMLRKASHAIPEIRLRLEQLDIVQSLIRTYYADPAKLSNTMRASSALLTLSGYANFIVDTVVSGTVSAPVENNTDLKEAANAILTVLQSAPSLEVIPLSRYVDYLGFVPCAAVDGVSRGVVMYMPLSQTSVLDVVNNMPITNSGSHSELALIPREYVPCTTIAGDLSKNITTVEGFEGMANLVADEIADSEWILGETQPVLATIGTDQHTLVYAAMAKSEVTAVVKSDSATAPFRLLFATKIASQWRSGLAAATPDIAYFADPQSALIYQMGSENVQPMPLPDRRQTLDLSGAYDIVYQGRIADHLSTEIEKPYSFKIKINSKNIPKNKSELTCRFVPLLSLTGPKPVINHTGKSSHYALVKEPGVARDMHIILGLAAAYASSEDAVVADRAKSWLVESLAPLVMHPAVSRVAVRALNVALVSQNLDARKFPQEYKRVVTIAYFNTLLGFMQRFEMLDKDVAADLVSLMPTSSLQARAAITLASLPTKIDIQSLQD